MTPELSTPTGAVLSIRTNLSAGVTYSANGADVTRNNALYVCPPVCQQYGSTWTGGYDVRADTCDCL